MDRVVEVVEFVTRYLARRPPRRAIVAGASGRPLAGSARNTGVFWCDLGSTRGLTTAIRRADAPVSWLAIPSGSSPGLPANGYTAHAS